MAAAEATNTAAAWVDGAFVFVGRDPGPEIAAYLRDVCIRAVDTELKAFKAGKFYRRRRALWTRRAAAADFVAGMVARLRRRIRELFARLQDKAATAAADRALATRFPGLVTTSCRKRETQFGAAISAGWDAGDRVALNHGVSGEAPRQIEDAGRRP